ncbi:MAG: sensor histidine kinase [Muribaculaceae bacterium]
MKWYILRNLLLFTVFGIVSHILIAKYATIPQYIYDIFQNGISLLYTAIAFNVIGALIIVLTRWANNNYISKSKRLVRFYTIYAIIGALMLAANYAVCVLAKILAGVTPVYILSRSGWVVLSIAWFAEMAISSWLMANHTVTINNKLREETMKLQIENSEAQYKALQSQLNPHFLFNSLNTLIAEISYNPDNAVQFTRNLSNVYRYVLQCQDKQVVSISEELEFLNAYIFLHKVRLGECISSECKLTESFIDQQIPPLTLQLLVENVIKHNTISSAKPMTITIGSEDDYLVVSNPIAQKKSKPESNGIGLSNLNNRCNMICGKGIIVIATQHTFTVKIPTIS